MNITIKRPEISGASFTISELLIDNVFFCHVIEDRDRGLFSTDTIQYILSVKVKHETAIPYGLYKLIVSFSNRFKLYLPQILDVPGFEGIRIHPGNTEADSSGCLLPGIKSGNKVVSSRSTMNSLFTIIKKRSKVEKVFIEIKPYSN